MIYLKYLLYILKHKWYVFLECVKEGILIRGITHDLSKFRIDEFIPYAEYFYGNGSKQAFDRAWEKHKARNSHHPEHWELVFDGYTNAKEMPEKDRLEMLCDWNAMSKTQGGTTLEYYEEKGHNNILHNNTRKWLENRLGYDGKLKTTIGERIDFG